MSKQDEENAVSISVPSKDPEKKEEKLTNGKVLDKDEKSKGEELTEEDAALKAELEMLVERLKVSHCLLARTKLTACVDRKTKLIYTSLHLSLYARSYELLRAA